MGYKHFGFRFGVLNLPHQIVLAGKFIRPLRNLPNMNLSLLKLPRQQGNYLYYRLLELDGAVSRASRLGDDRLAGEAVQSLDQLLLQDRGYIRERPSAGFSAVVRTCHSVDVDSWDLLTETLQGYYAFAHFLLSKAHIQLGQFESAVRHATRANELGAPNAEVYYDLGFASYQLMQYEEAAANYEKAIRLSPQDPRYYSALGGALTGLGKHKEALTVLRKSIGLGPGNSDAHNTLSYAFIQIGDYKAAIDSADEAIKIDSGCAFAHNNRGRANMKLGRFSEAVKDLETAVRLEPRLLQSWSHLGRAYQAEGNMQKAGDCYNGVLVIMRQIKIRSKDQYLAAVSAERGLNEIGITTKNHFEMEALSKGILTKKVIAFYLT